MGSVDLLLELLLPPRCPGCGREGALLCAPCRRPLRRRLTEPAGAPLGLPAPLPAGLVQVEWCATYSGPVRRALHALKYGAERRLVEPLAEALAERWARAGAGGDVVTWVPVHPTRRRERGFDQAESLARCMAAHLHLPATACLARQRRTTAQHALGHGARAENVGGVFHVPEHALSAVAGRWTVVVDDILTTGATLSSCASALLAGGARAVSGITVARDR